MARKLSGSILLSSMLLLTLMLVIFSFLLVDYQLAREFTYETQNYYEAKIMVAVFQQRIADEKIQLKEQGKLLFNLGSLEYKHLSGDNWEINVIKEQRAYHFEEKFPEKKIQK